jgi:alkanesulfonate monooxygenase SsuD/methylene tetrahydromethanopterin reductase-like flavin-dependent oxidoreductase (luciferase family)
MRLGIAIPTFARSVSVPLEAAARAARSGARAVFAVDHLFPPGYPDRPSFEPFGLLAAVAAANPALGVGTLVARVGVRPPGSLAKQATALVGIAGGPTVLGLGMGDHLVRAEHETLGLPFPPPEDRAALAASTAVAMRTLFRGEPWPGDERVPALRGPLLPPGGPEVWIGGTGRRMVEAAARAAEGWNGWGLDADGFEDRVRSLRRAASEAGRDPDEVSPTWGGIVLVGRDRAELAVLEQERSARGVAWDPWRGTADDLRRFADRLEAAGATWIVCLPVGPEDRTELIARTLGDR